MPIAKNDFIEIEFVAKTKEGEVFDTNIKEEAEKAKLDIKEFKPFLFALGHNMIIKGLDKELEGKEIGKRYSFEIAPENAFGKRNPSLVRMIPLKQFTNQRIMPQKGMQLSLDGMIAKILSVSGGRVLVDFNNPLSGKNVIYDLNVKRKVEDKKEQVNALQDFFFRQRFDFELNDKLKFKIPSNFKQIIEIMSRPFEEILNLKVETEELRQEKNKEGQHNTQHQ